MGVGTLISVEEYLNTSYDPDVEYVDGVLVERNVGKWLHSLVQRNLIVAFGRKYPQVLAVPELRSKTREKRFRIPDVTVLLRPPETDVLLAPAFVAIEILSDEDRMTRVIEKLQEYSAGGTQHVWLFDPRLKRMFTFRGNALQEVEGDTIGTEDPRLELKREEIFHGVEG
jgi:Uma2 family endonuclease